MTVVDRGLRPGESESAAANAEMARRLVGHLHRWDGQRRLEQAVAWSPRGLAAGLVLAAIVIVVARTRPLLDQREMAIAAVLLGLGGLLVALLWVWLPRRTIVQKARFADRRFGLKERASTAVEVSTGRLQTTPALSERQLADAVAAVEQVPPDSLARPRPAWREIAAVAAVVTLLLVLTLLPNPQEAILGQRRALAQAIEEQAEELSAVADEIRSDQSLAEEQETILLRPVEDALEELRAGSLSQEEAVAVLSEAVAELRDLSERLGDEGLQQSLTEAGRALADTEASQFLSQAFQEGDLAAASAATNELADGLDNLSEDEQADLAERLTRSAAALEEIDPELAEAFQGAAEQLEAADSAAAEQSLRRAAGILQERSQEQAAAQRAASAAGQAEAARRALAQAGQGTAQAGEQPAAGEVAGGGGESQPGVQPGASGSDGETSEGAGGPGPGGGHSENVFVPEAVDLSGETGISVELPAECRANPELCGALLSERDTPFGSPESLVPYDQVFGQYRDNAYEALDQGYVPLGLKDFVRDYFSSLEPRSP